VHGTNQIMVKSGSYNLEACQRIHMTKTLEPFTRSERSEVIFGFGTPGVRSSRTL
jgi:hypothetical protein